MHRWPEESGHIREIVLWAVPYAKRCDSAGTHEELWPFCRNLCTFGFLYFFISPSRTSSARSSVKQMAFSLAERCATDTLLRCFYDHAKHIEASFQHRYCVFSSPPRPSSSSAVRRRASQLQPWVVLAVFHYDWDLHHSPLFMDGFAFIWFTVVSLQGSTLWVITLSFKGLFIIILDVRPRVPLHSQTKIQSSTRANESLHFKGNKFWL